MRLNGPTSLALRTGCRGALSWAAFAIVEAALFVVLPAARESSFVLTPAARLVPWAVAAFLYVTVGFAAGFAAGLVSASAVRRPERGDSLAPDLAQLTLVIAWSTHMLAVSRLSRSTSLSLAVALLVGGLLVLRMARVHRDAPGMAWATWLAGPWGAALALMAPIALRDTLHATWLTSRVGSRAPTVKMAVAAILTAALVAVLAGLGRLTSRPDWPARRVAVVRAAALPALAAVVLAAGWAVDAGILSRLREPAARPLSRPRGPIGVLLITMDSVRSDHLSTHGYPIATSPGLRALLSHATLFRHAVAASDMSLGTHGSLFTGVYPGRHGAYEAPEYAAGRPLGPGYPTLAERLEAAGYASIGAAANGYFLNAAYGVTRGFTLFDVRANDRLEMQSRFRRAAGLLPGGAFSVHRRAPEVNAVLLRGIDAARSGGRRFFAFANYMEAHAPYTADEEAAAAIPGYDPAGRLGGTAFLGRESRPVFDGRERRRLVSQYDAAIATLDRQITRLFDALRARGLYEGMLIVITSDHGEMLGEHGTFGHGTGLSEELLRVPLIVKLPWQREGRTVDARVSQVDVLPTVLDVLGLAPAGNIDGRSLLHADSDPDRVVMAESPPARVLYLGRFKLAVSAKGDRKLFDVAADPAGRVNLLDEPEPEVRRARRALEATLAAAGEGRRPAVDPAALERLKSLGYVR